MVSYFKNLDPSLHSIPYLLILHLQVRSSQNKAGNQLPQNIRPGGQLWPKAACLLRNFDPVQVRYVGHEWRELVELVGQAAQAVSKAWKQSYFLP
jgi:COP9 signalosome complex subunit 3